MEYNYIDLILGGILVYGAIKGLMKGLIVEIAGLLALVIGVWGAIHFSDVVGDYLGQKLDWNEKYISLSAFILTFIGIVMAISALGKALTSVASVIALGWLNKLFGAIFGLLKVGFTLSVILNILLQINTKFDFLEKKTLKESVVFEPLAEVAPTIFPMLKDLEIQKWWEKAYDKVEDTVDTVKDKIKE